MVNSKVTQAKRGLNAEVSNSNRYSPFVLPGSCFSKVKRENGRHEDATALNYHPVIVEPLKLQSLQFNGQEETYRFFKSRFNRVMKHIDKDLQVEYLLQCLDGEALRLSLMHIQDCDALNQIWRSLDQRYGNEAVAYQHHAKKLLDLYSYPACQTSADLKELYYVFKENTLALRRISRNPEAGEDFKCILFEALPEYLKRKVVKIMYGSPDTYTLDYLLALLDKEVQLGDMERSISRVQYQPPTGHTQINSLVDPEVNSYRISGDHTVNPDVPINKHSSNYQLPDTSQLPPSLPPLTLPSVGLSPSLQFLGCLTPLFPPPNLHPCLPPPSLSTPIQHYSSLPSTFPNLTQTSLLPYNLPPPNLAQQILSQNNQLTSSLPQSHMHPSTLHTPSMKPKNSRYQRRKPQRQQHQTPLTLDKEEVKITKDPANTSVTTLAFTSSPQETSKCPDKVSSCEEKIHRCTEKVDPPELKDTDKESIYHQKHPSLTDIFQRLLVLLLCICLFILGFVIRYNWASYTCNTFGNTFSDRAWWGVTSLSLLLFEFIKMLSPLYLASFVKIYSSVMGLFNTVSPIAWAGFNNLNWESLEIIRELLYIYIATFVSIFISVSKKDGVHYFKGNQIIKLPVL